MGICHDADWDLLYACHCATDSDSETHWLCYHHTLPPTLKAPASWRHLRLRLISRHISFDPALMAHTPFRLEMDSARGDVEMARGLLAMPSVQFVMDHSTQQAIARAIDSVAEGRNSTPNVNLGMHTFYCEKPIQT